MINCQKDLSFGFAFGAPHGKNVAVEHVQVVLAHQFEFVEDGPYRGFFFNLFGDKPLDPVIS